MSTSRTQSHIRGGVALSAALLGFAIASAASGSEAPLPTLTVSYADLNLSRIQDAHRLYHRLQLASVSVCGNFGESRGDGERAAAAGSVCSSHRSRCRLKCCLHMNICSLGNKCVGSSVSSYEPAPKTICVV